MSMIHRESSPAQVAANRDNSLQSTGPRTVQGKATSSRNALKPRTVSALVARGLAAIDEDPANFDRALAALSEAMRPRDAWEAAWIEDIAMLRWRVERLQRAEVGALTMRRRHFRTQRQRAAMSPTGSAGLAVTGMVSTVGFAGIADSVMKFRQVIELLKQLSAVVRAEAFEDASPTHIAIIYGKSASPQGIFFQAKFQNISKAYKEGRGKATLEDRKALIADLNREIDNYEQMLETYSAEHLADDPSRHDAELLLPAEELDPIIRYETHLENQIERKLRQFYARRRESTVVEAEPGPEATNREEGSDLACQVAQA